MNADLSHHLHTPILKNHPDQKPQIEPLESTSLRSYIPLLVILIICLSQSIHPPLSPSLPPSPLSRPSSLSLVVWLWQGFINLLLKEVKLRMSPHPSHLTCCYGAVCQVVPGDSPTIHVLCVFLSVLWVCQLLNETCRISHAAFMLLKIQCVTVSRSCCCLRYLMLKDFLVKFPSFKTHRDGVIWRGCCCLKMSAFVIHSDDSWLYIVL